MTVNIVGCGEAVGSYVGSSIMWHFQRAGIVFTVIEVRKTLLLSFNGTKCVSRI